MLNEKKRSKDTMKREDRTRREREESQTGKRKIN